MKEAPLTCKLPGQPTIEGYLYTQEKCNGFSMLMSALKSAGGWAAWLVALLIALLRGLHPAPVPRPALATASLWVMLHGVPGESPAALAASFLSGGTELSLGYMSHVSKELIALCSN